MLEYSRKFITIIVTVSLSIGSTQLAFAYVASSTNYRIENDTINIGGLRSSSGSYTMENSVGGIGTGSGTGSSYNLKAGYQMMNDVYLAISSASDVTMSPSIRVSGGTSDGSTGWTVTTDDPAGYSLSVSAATSPALKSSDDSFADYRPSNPGTPDYYWSVADTLSYFGFSPEGSDITSTYKDNGSACGTGSLDTTSACWDGLSTSDKTIATSAAANHPGGTGTTLRLRTGLTATRGQKAGSYSAIITATALAQ